jgi:hypothetical protein
LHRALHAPTSFEETATNEKPRPELALQTGQAGVLEAHPAGFFAAFFFLPFFIDFDAWAFAFMAAGAVASDPDFAAAPPLVPLAPPVCAKPPAADNASAMAATGMISARIMELLFKWVPGPEDRLS